MSTICQDSYAFGDEVYFTRIGDITWSESDCEELSGGYSQEMTVRLKRDMMIMCKIFFILSSLISKIYCKSEKSHIHIMQSETLS